MVSSKLFKSIFILGLMFGLTIQNGCVSLDPLDSDTDTTDTTNTDTNTDTTNSPSSTLTPILTITSLTSNITIAQGQTVLLTWQIQNLPANPTIDVLYKASTEQNNKTLISGLATSNVGSLQIDTYSFIPGLTYTISLQLKSTGTTVATKSASGTVTISSPVLSITSPKRDVSMLPSSSLNVQWAGSYLPSGAEIQTFFDMDKTYNNGNEIIVKTDAISAANTQSTGSITLTGQSLWSNSLVERDNPYYLGLRVVKNGQISVASYASGTVKLYGGSNFSITSPTKQMNLHTGDLLSVTWSTLGIPNTLTVKLSFIDKSTGDEISTGSTYYVTAGGTNVSTAGLTFNHTYNIVATLFENTSAIKVAYAAGSVFLTTEGSFIYISNTELASSSGVVYLGLENDYTITWEVTNPPTGGQVDLYADIDGNYSTTSDQIAIATDLTATDGQYVFTPTATDFAAADLGKYYHIIARLHVGSSQFNTNVSAGTIRIGEGGIDFTSPLNNVSLQMGDTLDIEWAVTGDVCTSHSGQMKLKLYLSTDSTYSTSDVEISPTGGLNPCAVTSFTFDPSTLEKFQANTTYYIIGRLYIDGNDVDEARVSAPGKINSPEVSITVPTPTSDIKSGFDSINVTWTIQNLTLTSKAVRILAVNSEHSAGLLISPSSPYAADAFAGTADATNLPPGTYRIRCEVFGMDLSGNEIVYASGEAKGKIIIADGYNNIYKLSAMAAAAADPSLGSPVDGTIFEGANIEDSAGYEVTGMGDLNGDTHGDFIIFSRYGKTYGNNQAGAGYLIYGQSNLGSLLKLSNVAGLSSNTQRINGTIILLPMENAAFNNAGTYSGGFFATPLPDISGDGLGEVMVSCPTAAPILLHYENTDATYGVTITDPYGKTFTLPANSTRDVIAHASMSLTTSFHETVKNTSGSVTVNYGVDYLPGYTVTITLTGLYDTSVPPNFLGFGISSGVTATRVERASTYLLTSDRLRLPQYSNAVFDMLKVGDDLNMDSLAGTAADEMQVCEATSGDRFGFSITPVPSLTNTNTLELIITNPDATVVDFANADFLTNPLSVTRTNGGLGMMYHSSRRLGISFYESVSGLSSLGSKVDFIGNVTNAHLASVAAMGKITGTNNASFGGSSDFDGDGNPDLVLGCLGNSTVAGAIYIVPLNKYYNYKNPLFDLNDIYHSVAPDLDFENPIPGITINGTAGDNLGENIKSIGDFNGDGLADFVVALPDQTSSGGLAAAGRVMIIFGKNLKGQHPNLSIASVTSAQVSATGLNALIFEGTAANDHFGSRICAVGDVNGDQLDDLLVASPDADDTAAGKTNCGKIYLIYGRSMKPVAGTYTFVNGGTTAVDYDQDGSADGIWSASQLGTDLEGAVFVGEDNGDQLQSMTRLGDVNGDGINDFMIGAPFADGSTGMQDAGKAYLILGRRFSWSN